MVELIRNYRSRPWPKLEIPTLRRQQLTGLILYVALLLTGCWWIWSQPKVQAEYFLLLSAGVPLLYIFKSRWVTIVGLLTFQVVAAFIFMGNQAYVLGAVLALTGAIVAFESPILLYLFLVFAVWIGTTTVTAGVSLRMEFIIGVGLLVGWLFNNLLKPEVKIIRVYMPEIKPLLLFLFWAVLGFILWCP